MHPEQTGSGDEEHILHENQDASEIFELLRRPDHEPQQVIELLGKKFPRLRYAFNLNDGTDEGEKHGVTIADHTGRVVHQFLQQFGAEFPSSAGVSREIFELALYLHDIGKGVAVEEASRAGKTRKEGRAEQYKHTIGIIQEVFQQLGLTEDEIKFAINLIDGNPLGDAIYQVCAQNDNKKDEFTEGDVVKTAKQIRDMAEKSGLDAKPFLELLRMYFLADALSYTEHAGNDPEYDWGWFEEGPDGKMRLIPEYQAVVNKISQAI